MKKSFLIKAAVAIMLVATMLFAVACGAAGFSKNYLPVKVSETPALDTAAEIKLGTNERIKQELAVVTGIFNDVIIVENTTDLTYYLYGLKAQTALSDKNYTSINYCENGIFIAAKKVGTETKYGLLNAKGEVVKEFEYKSGEIQVSLDGKVAIVKNDVFKIGSDMKLSLVSEIKGLTYGITQSDVSKLSLFGDYILAFENSILTGAGSLRVYDVNGTLIKNFLSETATNAKYFALNGGKILIMRDFVLPDDAKDYTYFDNTGKKRTVGYELYSLKDKSSKTVKFDYYITGVYSADYESYEGQEFLSKDMLKTSAVNAYEIKNKKLVQNAEYQKNIYVDSSLNIKADFGLYSIDKLSDKRFLFSAISVGENSYIKDENGKIVVTISANFTIISATDGIIVVYDSGTKKYGAIDYDGNEKVGFKYDSLTPFRGGKAVGSIIGSTTTQYYSVSDSGSESSITGTVNIVARSFYKVSGSDDVYSTSGKSLFKTASTLTSHYLNDGTCFLYNNTAKVYYYVK